MLVKLDNIDGLEGKFLTVGNNYRLTNGISAWFVQDDQGDYIEVTLYNFTNVMTGESL